jgi:hypothetical protein
VVERWFAGISASDGNAVLARLSEHPCTVFIGTDPNEWWQGKEARAVFGRQIEEMPGHPITIEKLDAWEEQSFGWASGKLMIEWAGRSYEARFTCALHLQRGEWKIVQYHLSLPQANEAIGLTLTTTLEELEQALQREQPDLADSLAVDGTVTIVFTDIVDSTVMLSQLGDHAWLDVIRRHNAVIEGLAAAHGGTVVETQGDGSMLAFSSARRAVAGAKGDPASHRTRLRRLLTANPSQDRHPHRRRSPGGRTLLRHYRALCRACRQSSPRRRSARLRSRTRSRRQQRLRHHLPRKPRGRIKRPRRPTPALRTGSLTP